MNSARLQRRLEELGIPYVHRLDLGPERGGAPRAGRGGRARGRRQAGAIAPRRRIRRRYTAEHLASFDAQAFLDEIAPTLGRCASSASSASRPRATALSSQPHSQAAGPPFSTWCRERPRPRAYADDGRPGLRRRARGRHRPEPSASWKRLVRISIEDHPIRPGEVWDLTYRDHPEPHAAACRRRDRLARQPPQRRHRHARRSSWRSSSRGADRSSRSSTAVFRTNVNGKAYVGPQPPLPSGSVGFWISVYPLSFSRVPAHQGRRYWFPEGAPLTSVAYVGMEPQLEVIPAGALVRFSLSRWAAFPPESEEKRCRLQVSGWFL